MEKLRQFDVFQLAQPVSYTHLILHPASTTHRQLSDAQLAAAGIDPGMVRFSVGIENIDDIIADLAQAFEKI